jgi:hypothetical protein
MGNRDVERTKGLSKILREQQQSRSRSTRWSDSEIAAGMDNIP